MSTQDEAAWGDFWAGNTAPGQGGGCLPAAWQGIDAAQRAAWTDFAKSIGKNARVLDLATGDGRVMAWLRQARPDLKLTGVDLSPQLPPAPAGTKVRAGVDMANLPFRDGQFAAVVSQFGFEYGAVEETAMEIARVLAPDGRAGLLTHRQDGAILAHNLSRRAQIEWALNERKLTEKALGSLKLRSAGIMTVPEEIRRAPAEGAARFGRGSAAWEIPEAIRQTLELGMRDNPANVARVLQSITLKAQNELGRIVSLERACAVSSDPDRISAAMSAAGFTLDMQSELTDEDASRPFANFSAYRRA